MTIQATKTNRPVTTIMTRALIEKKALLENEAIQVKILQSSLVEENGQSMLRFLVQDCSLEQKELEEQQKLFITFSSLYTTRFTFCTVQDKMTIQGPLSLQSHMLFDKGEIAPHVLVQESSKAIPSQIKIHLVSTGYTEIRQYDKSSDNGASPMLSDSKALFVESTCQVEKNELTALVSPTKVTNKIKEINQSQEKFTYVNIANLKVETVVHIWGVVIEFTPVRKSRGTDYVMTLILADCSCRSLENGISINLFSKSPSQFPQILKRGDILRLHRIKIQSYNQVLQGLSSKGYSFLSFDGEAQGHYLSRESPALSGSSRSEITLEDERRIENLRSWFRLATESASPAATLSTGAIEPLTSPLAKLNTREENQHGPTLNRFRKLVSDITKETTYFDFIGEVMKTMDTTFNSDQLTLILTDYTHHPQLRICQEPFAHPRIYLLCTFWDNHVFEASKLQVGQYVYLRNLHARFLAPMDHFIGVMHGSNSSQITILDSDHETLGPLLNRKKEFLHMSTHFNTNASMKALSSLTTHPHQKIPLTTMQELCHFRSCPFLFRAQVRIIGFFPSDLTRFSRPFCSICHKSVPYDAAKCVHCGDQQSFNWQFMFGLIAADSTGRLPFLCYGIEAERFLNGLQAAPILKGSEAETQLGQKLLAFMSDKNGLNGPLLDICIQSYYKSDDMGQTLRRYALFDTHLTF